MFHKARLPPLDVTAFQCQRTDKRLPATLRTTPRQQHRREQRDRYDSQPRHQLPPVRTVVPSQSWVNSPEHAAALPWFSGDIRRRSRLSGFGPLAKCHDSEMTTMSNCAINACPTSPNQGFCEKSNPLEEECTPSMATGAGGAPGFKVTSSWRPLLGATKRSPAVKGRVPWKSGLPYQL